MASSRPAADFLDPSLDGLVPNTPATAKLSKSSAKRRQMETPSMSRVKADIPSSSPDRKTPSQLENQLNSLGAVPYVFAPPFRILTRYK